MGFCTLQNNLRELLRARIKAGELSGRRLAKQTGFKQPHVSNFLNRKRGLSLEGLDRMLVVERLSIFDLIDHLELINRAVLLRPGGDDFQSISVTDPWVAATEARIMGANVKDVLKFKKTFLEHLTARPEGNRSAWERFVTIRATNEDGISMHPRLRPGAVVLLDRHHNSLTTYDNGEWNMYAVRDGRSCRIRYLEVMEKCIILWPHNRGIPLRILTVENRAAAADYIVGRVCYVGMEL